MNNPDPKNEKRAVALYSILAAVVMIVGKSTVGLMTGSLAILTDALHSLLDMGASIITYFAVRISDRPADQHHHFGHGKVESLAALAQVIILLLTCIWIIYEAIGRLTSGESVIDMTPWAYIVIVAAIIIDITRVRALRRTAKKYKSQALEADALNFSTDIYSSLVVLFGLAAVSMGWPMADAVAAIGVAIFILTAIYRLGKQSIDVLLDRAPLDTEGIIIDIVTSEPEVIGVDSIRLRSDGRTTFAELILDVDRSLSFARASELKSWLNEKVRLAMKDVDVTCSFRPVSPESEEITSAIRFVVSSFGLSTHHVIIGEEDGGHFVSMHIEMPGDKTLDDAHNLTGEITKKLHETVKGLKKIVIHTQPYKSETSLAGGAPPDIDWVAERVKSIVESFHDVEDCHNIVLTPHKDGLALSADMRLDGKMTLARTDSVSIRVQEKLHEEMPELKSITLHLEPFKN
ncbi:MAG: cation diffusion facilitator family transporter [candidate division Zixibacteria bacterium]